MEQSQIVDTQTETTNFGQFTNESVVNATAEQPVSSEQEEPEVSRVPRSEVKPDQKTSTPNSRPKRKASLGVYKAILDDEYDSPSTYKNSTKRQGAGGSAKGSRTSKARAATALETTYVSTAVPVEILPDIFEDVMEILSKSNKNIVFDKYAIQNLVVTAALDDATFSNSDTARENILAHVLDTVKEDKQGRFNLTARRKNGRFDSDWRDPIVDSDIIKRYHELMEGEDEKRKRSYRNEERKGYTWTRQDLERFKVAFKKYGYSPTANRKIAKAIGPHMHPNHVGYFKQRLRRLHEKRKVEEIVESQAWETMVSSAPAHSVEDQPADAFAPNIIAGTTATVNLTTPAMAAAPKDPNEVKRKSFVPKRKKKRKPPPPRKKRSLESADTVSTSLAIADGSAMEEDVDIDSTSPDQRQQELGVSVAAPASNEPDTTVDMISSEAMSTITKDEHSSNSVQTPPPPPVVAALSEQPIKLISLPPEFEFPMNQRMLSPEIISNDNIEKPLSQGRVGPLEPDMMPLPPPSFDPSELDDDMDFVSYGDTFYDEPVFVPPPSESQDEPVQFRSSLEPPPPTVSPIPPAQVDIPPPSILHSVAKPAKEPKKKPPPVQPSAAATRPKRGTKQIDPTKPRKKRQNRIPPPGCMSFSLSDITTPRAPPQLPPILLQPTTTTPSVPPLTTDFTIAMVDERIKSQSQHKSPTAASAEPPQRLASLLVAPMAPPPLFFPPNTILAHANSSLYTTHKPRDFMSHPQPHPAPASSSSVSPQISPPSSSLVAQPFPDFSGAFPTPMGPSASAAQPTRLPPFQSLPFPSFTRTEPRQDELHSQDQSHESAPPQMPFWM